MAHPDIEEAVSLRVNAILDIPQQRGMTTGPDFGVAELPHLASLHHAAQLRCHRLHAIANAKHWHARLEYGLRRTWSAAFPDRGRAG